MNLIQQQLKMIVKFLADTHTDYVILGGLAVSLYGDPRFTADIDVNIVLEEKKISNFLQRAKKYGFYPIPSNIRKFIKKTGVIPMRFSKGKIQGRCDFIIAQNIIEDLALKRGRIKKLETTKAKFVSPEDLIIHKITAGRPRDIEDARGILIRQGNKLDIRYIKYWLKMIDRANNQSKLIRSFNNLLK